MNDFLDGSIPRQHGLDHPIAAPSQLLDKDLLTNAKRGCEIPARSKHVRKNRKRTALNVVEEKDRGALAAVHFHGESADLVIQGNGLSYPEELGRIVLL